MATKKNSDEPVRLEHANGATVSVSAEKAERLLAGVGFSKVTARQAKSSSDDK